MLEEHEPISLSSNTTEDVPFPGWHSACSAFASTNIQKNKKPFTLQWPTPSNTQLQTEKAIGRAQTKHPRNTTRRDSKLFQSLPAALHRREMAKKWSCDEEPDSQHEELEDTMTKQNQYFKQPQNEKEEIQKELQKVKAGAGGGGEGEEQKLDGFWKENS